MRPPNFNKIKNTFILQVDESTALLNKSLSLYNTNQLLSKDLYKVTELSFLKIFLSWEKFLEDTFISYMLVSQKGRKFKSYINAKSIDHAFQILKEGRDFPEWTKSKEIIRKSELFFKDGEPFKSKLSLVNSELVDMIRIRNAIVHISESATSKFKVTVRSNMGKVPAGITPGKFLLKNKSKNNRIMSYFEFYKEILKITADGVVV